MLLGADRSALKNKKARPMVGLLNIVSCVALNYLVSWLLFGAKLSHGLGITFNH